MKLFKNNFFLLFFGLSTLIAANSVYADIVQYTYTHSQHRVQIDVAEPAATEYLSVRNTLDVYSSAGLDKKIRIKIVNSSGVILSSSETTQTISASDRFTVDGKSYYGKGLQLIAPEEGQYTVIQEILTPSNEVTETFVKSIIIDTTAPTSDEKIDYPGNNLYGQDATSDVWKIGASSSYVNQLYLNNIDDNFDVDKIVVASYRSDGSLHKSQTNGYNSATKSVSTYHSTMLPVSDLDELLKIEFQIHDKAGNISTVSQSLYFDNISNPPTEPYAVYDPDSTTSIVPNTYGFVKYTSGMAVKTNPIQFIYRLEKSNWHEFRNGGLNLFSRFQTPRLLYSDENYAYVKFVTPYGNKNQNDVRWVNFGTWGNEIPSYNVTLHADAPKSLLFSDTTEFYYSDVGWDDWNVWHIDNSRLPLTITKMKVHLEPRSYVQVANHRGYSCSIPIGEGECIIEFPDNFMKLEKGTTGYLHAVLTIYKSDKTLYGSNSWAEVHWNDLYYPEISTSFEPKGSTLTAEVYLEGHGSYFQRLILEDTWLENNNGTKFNIAGKLVSQTDGSYTYQWDLSSLPEGSHNINVVSKEMHGPLTKEHALTFNSDKTTPTVTFNYENNSKTIKSLDEVTILALDNDSEITLTQIRLEGGPANEDVYLTSESIGSDKYKLLYPVLFPSESQSESYTLSVTAEDYQGNTTTVSDEIYYEPSRIGLNDGNSAINLPNIGQSIYRTSGKHAIHSEPISLNNGTTLVGTYPVYASLRSDATGNVVIQGLSIKPGETKTISESYNFASNNGSFNFSLETGNTDSESQGSLLIGTTAPNTPVLVFNYSFKDLAADIEVDTEPFAVVEAMSSVVGLNSNTQFCKSLTHDLETAKNSDPYANPICLVTHNLDAVNETNTTKDGKVIFTGEMPSLSYQDLEIRITSYSGSHKFLIGEYTYVIRPKSPDGTIKSALSEDVSNILHEIEEVDLTVNFDTFTGCNITGDRFAAIDYAFDKSDVSGETKCYLEWTHLPEGVEKIGTSIRARGYAMESGTSNFSWTLSVFHDGENKLVLSSGSVATEVIVPETPNLLTTTLEYSSARTTEGTEHLLRDSQSTLNSIKFKVEERNFAQVVSFNGLTCSIPAGLSECRISPNIGPFGDKENYITGVVPILTSIDSNIPYFEPRQLGSFNHVLNWDYTPPRLIDVLINNKKDGTKLTNTITGTELTLDEDEAAMIVYSPFTDLTADESWKLQNPTLTIESDETVIFEQSVFIDDNSFFFAHDKVNLDENNLKRTTSVNVVGNYIIYKYDFNDLPDGAFKFKVDLRDQYQNGADYTHETFLLQRTAPQVQLSYLRDKARVVDSVYFASDFGAVTNPGWDNNNKIIEATFGGQKLTLVDDPANPRNNVKFFESDLSTLEAGNSYSLVIKAQDTAGNIGELVTDFIYAPSKFNIKSSTGNVELYQYVQRGTAYISQSQFLCNYVSSKELAQQIAREARKGCYVEIDSLPKGMDTLWQGWALTVTGSIHDLDDNQIVYSAYVVNPDGQEVRVAHESFEWDLRPAEAMTFEMTPIIKLDDKVYGLIPENPVLARYKLENVAGEVNIDVTRGSYNDSEFMAQRSHKAIYELLGLIRDDDVSKRKVFDKYPLKINASYNLSPAHNAQEEGDVIVLPSRKVALNLNVESEGTVLSTDVVKVKGYMGEWNWLEKTNIYNPDTMGEWDVYLAYKDNKGVEHRITDIKRNDSAGQVEFDVEIDDIFRKSSGFYAVANVDSPHSEYTQTLKSTPTFLRIVLGTGVDGKLSSNQVRGKVPFTTLIRYDYETIEDMVAGNDALWYISEDNSNWEVLEEYNGRSAIPFLVQKAGDYYVRATVTNKNTGESTTTESLKISGYDKANLLIKGPNQVYDAQEMTLQMYDYNEKLTDYDGEAQWSRDNGVTWSAGSTSEIMTTIGEQELVLGRFKYNTSTSGAGDDAWAVSRFYVRPVAPRPVMAQVNAPHLVEVDIPFTVTAQVMNMNSGVDLPIKYEWLMPNGETSTAQQFEYTASESDLDDMQRLSFTLRAWVEGYKTETFRETQRNLEAWVYEFPETEIAIRSTVLVAPASITGMIEQQRTYMPGITYEYEWQSSDDIEVTSPDKLFSAIVLKTPGVHELKAKITDSRGMVKEVSKYIDVLEPEPVEGDFLYFPSNRYSRAPLGLVTRALMVGGHPRDYIIDYKWYINGVEQEPQQSRSPIYRFEIETPGNYEIKVVSTSLYGQVTEVVENYTVHSNKLPICESVQEVRSGTIRINANCKDEDGYVSGYDWWFNGEYVGRGAAQTQLRLSEYPSMTVTFEAIDDAGGRTRGEFSW